MSRDVLALAPWVAGQPRGLFIFVVLSVVAVLALASWIV